MKTAIFKNWHAWEAGASVFLSCEGTKSLFVFNRWDDCINYLYLSGEKDAARAVWRAIR